MRTFGTLACGGRHGQQHAFHRKDAPVSRPTARHAQPSHASLVAVPVGLGSALLLSAGTASAEPLPLPSVSLTLPVSSTPTEAPASSAPASDNASAPDAGASHSPPSAPSSTAATPTPTSRTPAAGYDAAATRHLLSLVNAHRTGLGLPALTPDDGLGAQAVWHSTAMADAGRLFHADELFTRGPSAAWASGWWARTSPTPSTSRQPTSRCSTARTTATPSRPAATPWLGSPSCRTGAGGLRHGGLRRALPGGPRHHLSGRARPRCHPGRSLLGARSRTGCADRGPAAGAGPGPVPRRTVQKERALAAHLGPLESALAARLRAVLSPPRPRPPGGGAWGPAARRRLPPAAPGAGGRGVDRRAAASAAPVAELPVAPSLVATGLLLAGAGAVLRTCRLG